MLIKPTTWSHPRGVSSHLPYQSNLAPPSLCSTLLRAGALRGTGGFLGPTRDSFAPVPSSVADGDWARGGCQYFRIPVILMTIQLEKSPGTGCVGQAANERRGPGPGTCTLTAPLLLLANTVHGLFFTQIHQHLLDVKV